MASTTVSPRRLSNVTRPATVPCSTYPDITACMRASRALENPPCAISPPLGFVGGCYLMTKTVRIHETGGPEVLRIEDLPVAAPGPGEIRIRVQSIGLNRSEAIYRSGKYFVPAKLPSLMGYEAYGVVEALGPGVQGHAPG